MYNITNSFCLLVKFKGGVYDPADIDLVNKLNGVKSSDSTPFNLLTRSISAGS